MSAVTLKNEELKEDVENLNETLASKLSEIHALKGELKHLESLSKGRSRSSVETDSALGQLRSRAVFGYI